MPFLPSVDASSGAVWWPDEGDEEFRRGEYERFCHEAAPGFQCRHGSAVVRLAARVSQTHEAIERAKKRFLSKLMGASTRGALRGLAALLMR